MNREERLEQLLTATVKLLDRWEEYSHETKIDQVLKQLRTGQAKIAFDLVSKTCNIIPSR